MDTIPGAAEKIKISDQSSDQIVVGASSSKVSNAGSKLDHFSDLPPKPVIINKSASKKMIISKRDSNIGVSALRVKTSEPMVSS